MNTFAYPLKHLRLVACNCRISYVRPQVRKVQAIITLTEILASLYKCPFAYKYYYYYLFSYCNQPLENSEYLGIFLAKIHNLTKIAHNAKKYIKTFGKWEPHTHTLISGCPYKYICICVCIVYSSGKALPTIAVKHLCADASFIFLLEEMANVLFWLPPKMIYTYVCVYICVRGQCFYLGENS